VVDATRATVDNEAELVAASARLSCPLAISYLAVSVQDLMAADNESGKFPKSFIGASCFRRFRFRHLARYRGHRLGNLWRLVWESRGRNSRPN
jgi:hypothetical protein